MSDTSIYAEPRFPAREECTFYHRIELPESGVVEGLIDLGDVDEYLGRVALAGRRVLEIGPASGALTFHMERAGAEVVAVELPPEHPWDMVPLSYVDLDAILAEKTTVMERLRNGFWYGHREMGSAAKVLYGDAHRLPESIGRFDVAVLAAVLLHTRDAVGLVNEAARVTDHQLVITEVHEVSLGDLPLAHIQPTADNALWHTWWTFSPGFFRSYLPAIGFGQVEVTYCSRVNRGEEQLFYTVVATRT